jgi:hypothetical protein
MRAAHPQRLTSTGESPGPMWKTIGYLTLMCGVFIAMLISLAIIGLK